MKIVPFNPQVDSLVFALNMINEDLERIAIEHIAGNSEVAMMLGMYHDKLEKSYQVPLTAIKDMEAVKTFLKGLNQEVVWRLCNGKVFECKKDSDYYMDAFSKPIGKFSRIIYPLAVCDYTRCTMSNEYWVLV